MALVLRLFADRIDAGEKRELRAGPVRVLYVRSGSAAIASGGSVASLAPNSAWHGAASLALAASTGGAEVLRFELVASVAEGQAPLIVSPPLALDPRERHLMRCDRVEFPPGGVAYRHTHQGPGLRCLVAGSIRIDAGGASHAYRPGEAWFENGVDPVFAAGSERDTTAFIRVMVLPRAIIGKSSIRYVDEADKDKPRLQRYQIYIDHPIELPGNST
jgi:quercetin dioxygenase-like cupin family protein